MPAAQKPVDPIAIVGIGCRYAGVRGPAQFWQLLRSGTCAVREVPQHRIDLGYDIDHFYDPRPRSPGKVASRLGGFVDHPELFDPAAFGLAPRDAVSMEPQQRLTIEVTWDALEDAGIVPESLHGERVAVIVGHMAEDYSRERIAVLGEESVNRGLDVFTVAGMSRAVLSGRISFLLGVTGPSFTLDTACSSSLIATHLACQSLWQGESTLALAGGVNLFLTPEGNIALSRSGMLALDGHCKAFDAGADGFVRAEGAGMVVLRPLCDALAAGDRIYALIRGSGTSADGRDGGHMMAPGRLGQAQAMRDAYARAQIDPSRVDYVETHGTGTVIGDPVEIRALADVMDEGRPPERPLLVASVKGNIGHAESASGVAGLIKAALSIHHREIPAQLHFREPSPSIDWDDVAVRVNTRAIPWPHDGPAIAGVNSFGISGTNAHVVLESAPAAPPDPAAREADGDGDAPFLVPITAHTEKALAAMAERQRDALRDARAPRLADLAHTLCRRRSHRSERVVVVARSNDELASELDTFLQGGSSGVIHTGSVRSGGPPDIVFVFPGQGGQWPGMGRQLLRSEPFFHRSIRDWDHAFSPHVDWSLERVLADPVGVQRLCGLDVLQPALIALEIALAELWMHRGVRPTRVVGQSMGEIAAAYTAGCLDRADVARLACERGRQVDRAAGRGAMCVISLPTPAVRARLDACDGRAEVSGTTSPATTVVSGDREVVRDLVASLDGEGFFARLLDVDFASHCFHMDPLLDDFAAAIEGLAPRAGHTPFFSTVEGKQLHGEDLGAVYWTKNLRAPVLFERAAHEVMQSGGELFLEISPHPTLGRALGEIARAGSRRVMHLGSLRREQDDRLALLATSAALFARGVALDFEALQPGGRLTDTPLYAYQRERYWFGSRSRAHVRRPRHPLLTSHLQSSIDDRVEYWEATLDADSVPWLDQHRLDGRATAPAGLWIDLALAAARERWPEARAGVQAMALDEALTLPSGGRRTLQVVLRRDSAPTASRAPRGTLRVLSRPSDRAPGAPDAPWTLHAHCTLVPQVQDSSPVASLDDRQERCANTLAPDDHHRRLASGGLDLGRMLRAVKQLQTGPREALARLALPRIGESEWFVHECHPALLAAGMQVVASAAHAAGLAAGPLLPISLEEVVLDGAVGGELWCHAELHDRAPSDSRDLVVADLTLLSAQGEVVGRVRGLRARQRACNDCAVDAARAERTCQIEWRPMDAPTGPPPAVQGAFVVVGEDGELCRSLVAALRSAGGEALLCSAAADVAAIAGHLPECRRGGFELIVVDGDSPGTAADAEPTLVDHDWLCALLERMAPLLSEGARGWWIVPRHPSASMQHRRFELPPGRATTDVRWQRIDLGPTSGAPACAEIAQLLMSDCQESHLALRSDSAGWLVARLVPAKPAESAVPAEDGALLAAAGARSFAARIVDSRAFDATSLIACDDPTPGRGEIVVEVEAAGLSSLDVLSVLGLRAQAGAPLTGLGCELAGRVVALGPDVRGLATGDLVFGFAEAAVASHARTHAAAVVPVPKGVDPLRAAGLPLAFCAALYALRDVARLQPGESVLVQSAGGGIGLAAVAIAARLGARVFATAGSALRRDWLAGRGVETVADSRAPDAEDIILRASGGVGVDVILGANWRDRRHSALALLAPGGRYVDLNPLDPGASGQAADPHFPRLSANRALHTLDLPMLLRSQPMRVSEMLREVADDLSSGALEPLPTTVFPVAELARAARFLVQARQVGKVVVDLRGAEHSPIARTTGQVGPRLRPDGRYAIHGLAGEAAARLADRMRGQGAGRVEWATDGANAIGAPSSASSDLPLRGVVCVATDVAGESDASAGAAPRRATLAAELGAVGAGGDLDFVLLVAPAPPWIGASPTGPGRHARFDGSALAARERELGRPTRHVGVVGGWSPADVADAVDRALGAAGDDLLYLTDDFVAASTDAMPRPILRELQRGVDEAAQGAAYRDALAALPRQARIARLHEIVVESLAGILSLGGAERQRLDTRAPLDELGLDSLMTLELHLGLINDLGIEVSPERLAKARSAADIATLLAEEVDRADESASP